MGFSIIVAHDLNRGIGINNDLPWHCPTDMAYFKALTTGDNQQNAVIMGRKTWESIPEKFRPLPNRRNIVLSNTESDFNGAHSAQSLEEALQLAEGADAVFVIGGAKLYAEALAHPQCDDLYVTKMFGRFNCDAHFPDYSEGFKCIYASNITVLKPSNCAFFRYIKN